MAKYSLLTQNLYDTSIGHYTSYGIIAKERKLTISVADISTDKFAVEQLIEKFNTYELSLCHLHDAVEDFLCDYNLE